MKKINFNNISNFKSSINPYQSHIFKYRLIHYFTIILLISASLFIDGCGGGEGNGDGGNGKFAGEIDCSDGVDNDGDTEVDCADIDCILDPACPSCDEIVAILCDRLDQCGFALDEECVVDYIFNDLSTECSEFLAEPFTNECMDDIDNFDCDTLGEDVLPESCGGEFTVPEGIQVPPGACEGVFVAECSRLVECDSLTFDECLLVLLFLTEDVLGVDCSDVSEGETIDECIEDFEDFDCDLMNDGLIPDSCTGVIVPN